MRLIQDGSWGRGARRAVLGVSVVAAAACGGSEETRAADEAPAATPGLTGAATDSVGAQAGVAGAGQVDTTGSINTPGSGQMRGGDPSDASVAALMALIDRTEVESGEIAARRASNPEVKRYAQEMVAAHRPTAGVQPAAMAETGESDLTTPIRDAHMATVSRLQSAAAGADFDRAYITSQVAAHQSAHQTLERLRAAARDNNLTDRIRQKMASVQQHLTRARTIQQALGG